jgi:hypothetical protein
MSRTLFFISTFLLVATLAFAAVCPHQTVGLKKWSDEATWKDAGVPVPTLDSIVSIPQGLNVLMDVINPPKLAGIEIANGASLIWDLKPIHLNVSHILVNGLLQIGSEECPFDQNTVITLEDEDNVDVKVGKKVIGVLEGGELIMYGKVYSPVWTRLNTTATKGSNTLRLIEPVEWQVGDAIVIAPTGYDPNESEERIIEKISEDKRIITLNTPLSYNHFGESPESNNGFEERAEVGVLNRFIKLQGNDASDANGYGGHTMCIKDYVQADFVGVEFTRMGQRGELARYPIHYHVVDIGRFIVKDNSIHKNYQRCVTLHSSSNLHVLNNLCYDVQGHAMFIEDGYDTGAVLDNNLVIHVKPGILQPHDKFASSGFFLTGPNNTLTNNQVSGAVGNGYWLATPMELIGPSHTTYAMAHPYRTQLGVFENNKARTLQQSGLFVDLGPDMSNVPVVMGYDPRVDPLDETSDPAIAAFTNLQVTKCQQFGVHTRGGDHAIVDAKIASCFAGVRFANAPFATVRQTMTRGTIYRTTLNDPTAVPNQSGDYSGLPQRGIVPYGGSNRFTQVVLKGFTLPAGACLGPLGNETLSPSNTFNNIDCSGQSLLYTSGTTDNEKMFAAIQVQNSETYGLVVNNEFMTLSSCKTNDDSTLKCEPGSYATVVLSDDDIKNTVYPKEMKVTDPHATIYRLDSDSRSVKTSIDVFGMASTTSGLTTKTSSYSLNVPMSLTDAYGVSFKHQTPSKLNVTIDNVPTSAFAVMTICYPSKSVIQSIKRDDGTSLTAVSSETELSQAIGNSYLFDQESGRLVLPVVSIRGSSNSIESNPTLYQIQAQVSDSKPIDCFEDIQARESSSDARTLTFSSLLLLLVIAFLSV